jgi:hypothetical protein
VSDFRISTGDDDAYDIEAIGRAWRAESIGPNHRGTDELAPLSPRDCFDRIAEGGMVAGLHLDEGHRTVSLDNQVQIAAAAAKALGHDPPPPAAEPSRRDRLTDLSELLSRH